MGKEKSTGIRRKTSEISSLDYEVLVTGFSDFFFVCVCDPLLFSNDGKIIS